jgi:two-component sensor histidine kinase
MLPEIPPPNSNRMPDGTHSLADETLKLEWRESGGPPVLVSPSHRGFGFQLLSSALDQFGGAVETVFENTGLICRIRVDLVK